MKASFSYGWISDGSSSTYSGKSGVLRYLLNSRRKKYGLAYVHCGSFFFTLIL